MAASRQRPLAYVETKGFHHTHHSDDRRSTERRQQISQSPANESAASPDRPHAWPQRVQWKGARRRRRGCDGGGIGDQMSRPRCIASTVLGEASSVKELGHRQITPSVGNRDTHPVFNQGRRLARAKALLAETAMDAVFVDATQMASHLKDKNKWDDTLRSRELQDQLLAVQKACEVAENL
ncbi:uncharacterized protein [Dermacentor albipictus]|uniref:uncharacterized protein isoform X2 n=1 Tax=Dermacentor albipictus TaxID=60249 RepID=UPI0031FE3687